MAEQDNSECRYYQEIIRERQYEREDVQEKTFTKWINAQLIRRNIPPVKDLFTDLRDGRVLIQLMEILTNTQIKPEIGKLRVHHIGNVNKILDLLRQHEIRLVNVNSNDIVDGNKKLTLALIWAVILTWQVKTVLQNVQPGYSLEKIEQTLVNWCRNETRGYERINIEDFGKSWKDGLAFNALLHKKNPYLFDYQKLLSRSASTNLEHAFRIAEETYGVDRYLDIEDVVNGEPDKKSVMVYVMSILDSGNKDNVRENGTIQKWESIGCTSFEQYIQQSERFLNKLRIACENCKPPKSSSIDPNTVKSEFYSHMNVMQDLTLYQNQVREFGRAGEQLSAEHSLDADQTEKLTAITAEIKDTWKNLHQMALEKYTCLETQFIKSQEQTLEYIENWILETEEKVSKLASTSDIPEMQAQLQTLRQLEQDIESKQGSVNELKSVIVVHPLAEKSTPDKDKWVKRVELVVDTWDTICRFVENRLITVQEMLISVKEMNEELAHCERWIVDKERAIEELKSVPFDDEVKCKSSLVKLTAIGKEADVIGSILEKIDAKDTDRIYHVHEKNNSPNSLRSKLQEYKERTQKLTRETEQLTSMLRTRSGGIKVEETTPDVQSIADTIYSSSARCSFAEADTIQTLQQNFHTECHRVMRWLDGVEAIANGQAFNELDAHKQYSALTELIQKFNRYDQEFSELHHIADGLQDALRDDEEKHNIRALHNRVHRKWKALEHKVTEMRRAASFKVDEAYVHNELCPVKSAIEDLENWCQNAQKEGHVVPIDVEDNSRTIKAYQERIEYLHKLLDNMEREHGVGSATNLRAILTTCKDRLDSVEKKIQHGQWTERETSKITHRHSENWPELNNQFVSWLEQTEQSLLEESFEVTSINEMETRRNRLKELREKINMKTEDLDNLRKNSMERFSQMTGEEARSCEWELDNLADRLTDAAEFVKDRSKKYSNAIKQLSEYESELRTIRAWFEHMEKAICEIRTPAGDSQVIQSQLHKANDLLDEAKSAQSSIDGLGDSAREISRYACPKLCSRLREDGDIITRQWSDVVGRIKDYTSCLEQALKKNRGFEDHVQELEMWVSDKNREVPADDSPVYYPEQISERLAKFKQICEEITRKEEIMNQILDESKNVISVSSPSIAQELSDDLSKLGINFANLRRKVNHKIDLYSEMNSSYTLLRKLLEEENQWLNKVQMKILSSSGATNSTEDSSRELEELQRLIKSHPTANRRQIRDLKKSLDAKRVLIPTLGNQITQFEFRYDQLQEEASKHIQLLEECVTESRRLERQIAQLQNWMTHVDQILSSKQDKSFAVGSSEFDALRDEFAEHGRILDMLSDKASFLRISGKADSARRLEQQISSLRKRYNELHQRYRQYQIPADFEPNLEHCRQCVHEVEQNIHAVDIKSDDPDIIQMQLDSCLKLYNMLSEIQPEVENVIRTGRKIVESGSSEHPENITRQLDSLKQTFNDMGAKVTNGKEKLESALKTLRRFQREYRQISDWLNKAEEEISKIESQPELHAADEQMDWIRSTKVDIRKLDSNFQILRSLQRDVEKEADKPLLTLTDKINNLEKRVEQFSRRLRERTNRIEEQQNQVEDLYQKFSHVHDDLQSRLDHIDSLLYNVERYYESELIEQINQQLSDVRPKLDDLRGLGRSLTTQSERYNSLVNPDIENLFRRLDEFKERLNSAQESQRKRPQIGSIPVTVSVGGPSLERRQHDQVKETSSRYFEEEHVSTHSKATEDRRRRMRDSHRREGSYSESTDEELTDDEFRKKYGRCLAYLQLIDKLVSKGALPSDASDLGEYSGRRVVDREMIERVIRETERTIHVIERKEPDRARKLRDMLSRLEEQLQRIESKIDAQGSVTPPTAPLKKMDKGVSGSTLADGYDSSDFLYSTDYAIDDRSVASEPVIYPPALRHQRYSRFDRWTSAGAGRQADSTVRLQPLLRVRSLRAVDRVQNGTAFVDRPPQYQRRFHSLERGGLTRQRAPMYYGPPVAAPMIWPAFYQQGPPAFGRVPIYRERIVDKHVAYRQQQATEDQAGMQQRELSYPAVAAERVTRTVPVRLVQSNNGFAAGGQEQFRRNVFEKSSHQSTAQNFETFRSNASSSAIR